MRAQADEIETQVARPGFWNDPNSAREALRRLSSKQETLSAWQKIQARHQALVELAGVDDEGSLEEDLRAEIQEIRSELSQLEDSCVRTDPTTERQR